MQNDKRLIDANALLKEFEKRQEKQFNVYCDCFLNDAQELSTEWWCVEDAVIAAPTIDAVEVVRCRVCIHRVRTNSTLGFSWCGKFGNVMRDADFCSWGERKMDGGAE